MIADARLLLLPVRSLTSSYRWATCPHLIERFGRDLTRAGVGPRPDQLTVKPQEVLATVHEPGPTGDTRNIGTLARDSMFLEERQFKVTGQPPQSLVDAIRPLILHNDTGARMESRLAVLNDDDFAWFARYGLPIQARNVLEDETKRSMNLWYEESLPPDTVMYALIAGRKDGLLDVFSEMLLTDPYLQVGGNETVGHGWFAATMRGSERSDK